jgi:tRNA G18 (ribose-2'-O)-methylase SpoU
MTLNTQKILILENIRSAQNVGAMLRTADAVGIDKVFLVGYTPSPVDRFGRPQKDVAKSALGAETRIAWESVPVIEPLLEALHADGFQLLALEQASQAIDYNSVVPASRAALLVGNEVDGVSAAALAQADVVLELPMRGMKESLNVSVATGIALYRLFDR